MVEKLRLKSGIYKNHKKSFILDEDGLRKIAGVIEASSREIGFPCQVVFYVWRKDERFYETTDIEDVLSDPNIGDKHIESMSIELRDCSPNRRPEPWEKDYVVQVFLRKRCTNTVTIDIGAEDRNWALLLADKLEPQIERAFKGARVPAWLVILCSAAIVYLLHGLTNRASESSMLPQALGVSFQVIAILGLTVFCYMSLEVGKLRPEFLTRYLGPESVFLWGDEIEQFSNRIRLRRNVFWVIVMGFLVSAISSLVFSPSL